MMEAGDTRVLLQAYPGVFAFLPGYKFFFQREETIFPTGEKFLPNWGNFWD